MTDFNTELARLRRAISVRDKLLGNQPTIPVQPILSNDSVDCTTRTVTTDGKTRFFSHG